MAAWGRARLSLALIHVFIPLSKTWATHRPWATTRDFLWNRNMATISSTFKYLIRNPSTFQTVKRPHQNCHREPGWWRCNTSVLFLLWRISAKLWIHCSSDFKWRLLMHFLSGANLCVWLDKKQANTKAHKAHLRRNTCFMLVQPGLRKLSRAVTMSRFEF